MPFEIIGRITDVRVIAVGQAIRNYEAHEIGELMSRLNNDVVGAQNAISSTISAR